LNLSKLAVPEMENAPEVAGWAVSFVFTLNAILHNDNTNQIFTDDSELSSGRHPTFPIECRYAMSYDDVLLLEDLTRTHLASHQEDREEDILNNLNCIGNAMVTCSRILSTDHGNHFLVDNNLLQMIASCGGLEKLCGGQWGQRLHLTLMNDVKVKSGVFRYADAFGYYHDRLLMDAIRKIHQRCETYHIGSHNIGSLDLD